MNLENSTPLNYQKYTILVVDDNPTNVGVLVDYLEEYGFQIMIARSGESALKKLEYAQPDLILLDVMMPGILGFEVCQRIKFNKNLQDIPVIFMTALTSADEKVKGFEVGAVDYVTKPINQEELLARITAHLRIRDLTQSLQKANTELVELNATKDKFFSIVAHDLKSPFNPLLGNVELSLALVDTVSRNELKEMLESIDRSAKRAYSLLENLLQWSRLEQGRMTYQPAELELKHIAQQSIKLLTENASAKNIDLSCAIDEETMVYADQNMLDVVIRNLLSNALKFTPPGGQVTISAEARKNGKEVASEPKEPHPPLIEVSVSDTGIGMSREDQAKLFRLDAHHSTQGTAKEEGTGLGLIVCQEMVEKNGGQIWIESEPGRGTRVKFTIPQQTAEGETIQGESVLTAA